MLSIQIHGRAIDVTDSRYRAEAAALAVFAAAGCTPKQAQDAYFDQFDRLNCEDNMTGLAATWLAAREAAEIAARQGWANPLGCWIEMDA
jgi:hypothetical protein